MKMFCDICKVYDEHIFKNELISAIKYFFSHGLVSVGGGNHSFRSKLDNQIWITPSGYPRSHITSDDLLLIDLDGNVLKGNLKPTIEVPFHTEIYKNRSDINAVCHVHNPYTSGYFLSSKLVNIDNEGIWTLAETPSIAFPKVLHDKPLVIEYKQLGSKGLGNLVGKASKFDCVVPFGIIILLNHGVIGVGRCIHEAKFVVDLCEEWAKCLVVKKLMN